MLHRRIAILLIVSMLASMGVARWFHVATAHATPAEGDAAIQLVGHGCSHAGCNPPAAPQQLPGESDSDQDPETDPAQDPAPDREPSDPCDICSDLTRHMNAAPSLSLPAVLLASPPTVQRCDATVTTRWTPLRVVDSRGPPAVALLG